MKRKSNYLPYNDIQGQQAFLGFEDSVCVAESVAELEPIKIDKNRAIKKLLNSLPCEKCETTHIKKDYDVILEHFPFKLVTSVDGYSILKYNYGGYNVIFKHHLLPVIKIRYDDCLKSISNVF